MNLFNKELLRQKIDAFKNFPEGQKYEKTKEIIRGWIKSLEENGLENIKEKTLEKEFLVRFFSDILGYIEAGSGESVYNLCPDYTISGLYADGALGFFSKNKENKVRAVIELKDALTSLDQKQSGREKGYTPVEQAFQYASKIDGCNWIIVSNFKEIRIYNKQRSTEYFESIDVLNLNKVDIFKKFYFLFSKENLISETQQSIVDNILQQTTDKDENISREFYEEYKTIRLKLFDHLQKYNQNIDKRILLEKTQKILDRFIFVLFCQYTNGLLPFNISRITYELGKKSRERSDERVWREFRNLFMDIDEGRFDIDPPINKYNGGLFSCDDILDNLHIKDEIWDDLIHLARYNYDSELNVNILGHIFEQSISDLEDLKAQLSGEKLDEPISQRNHAGIYYTPEYITKYIVEKTVGKYLEEHPEKLGSIKILDPACGSGAFLNQAHSHLLKEYKIQYDQRIAEKNAKGKNLLLFEDCNPTDANKNILLNNLFGVDLNEESVEITKLSLWIKTASKSEPLQNLDKNIKCGNSLINDPIIAGEKAFEWEDEFKGIMNEGGFDVVISNPPYVFARKKIAKDEKEFYKKQFLSQQYQSNTFVLFIEQSLKLLKNGGFLGIIVPNTLLMLNSISKLRKHILENGSVLEIVNLSGYSFAGVNVETVILIFQKTGKTSQVKTNFVSASSSMYEIPEETSILIDGSKWIENPYFEFNVNLSRKNDELLSNRLQKDNHCLSEFFIVKAGLEAYEVGKGSPKQSESDLKNKIYNFPYKIDDSTYPYLEGENVDHYIIYKHAYYLKYGKNLAAPRTFDLFSRPRVLIREITGKFPSCLMAAYTEEIYLNNRSIINVLSSIDNKNDLKYLAAILNSKVISFYFMKNTPKAVRQMFPKLILHDLRRFPLPEVDLDIKERIAKLTDSIQNKYRSLFDVSDKAENYVFTEYHTKVPFTVDLEWKTFIAKLDKQKVRLTNTQKEDLLSWFSDKQDKMKNFDWEIKELNNKINNEIYKLYKLTDNEIEIIEELDENNNN